MQLLKQAVSVAKVIKPKHIQKAMVSPAHAWKAFKYHWRRVPERRFVEFLARQRGCAPQAIDSAYADLNDHRLLWKEIQEQLSVYPDRYGLQMTREPPALYLLIRLIKPECIMETGVSAGVSSAYILRALHDNQKGKLYSIDLPPHNLPEGKESGWIVPEHLRDRWELNVGDAKDLLEPLLAKIGPIDGFIHDSLHTYDHMLWEFRTAWKYLRPRGLFLSHDVGCNEAFFDFMKEKDIPWKSYRVYHVLGGGCKAS